MLLRCYTALIAVVIGLSALSGPGTAVAYDLTATPASVDFGTVAPGVASASQTVTFNNPFWPSVSYNLATPAVAVSGADASSFSITGTTCSGLLNASCTATVTTTPAATGRLDATLQILATDGTSNFVKGVASLTSNAIAAPSVLGAVQSGFVAPAVGHPSGGIVTVTNNGPVPIPLGSASIAGSAAFSIPASGVNSCTGTALAPGAACGIELVFLPTAPGLASAQVSLASTGLSGPAVAPVSATAVVPEPVAPFYAGGVPICHSGNGRHFVSIAPNYRSIVGGSGHGGHAHDVIPPFRYPGGSYPGKNWPPTGAASASSCVRALIAGRTTASTDAQLTPPRPPVQPSVTLCHGTGVDSWQPVTVPADVAYRAHGSDARDIVPPFSITAGGGTIAFPGQNWDTDGRRILANGCREPDPRSPLAPAESVTLCSAPVSGMYARMTLTPAASLTYARENPTAIVPAFTYRTGSGTRQFEGLNWSSDGQRIFTAGCVDPNPPAQAITPSVQCVQAMADGTLTAYFDVANPNQSTVTITPGPGRNVVTGDGFAPPVPPAAFAPGSAPRVLTVTGIPRSGSATWAVAAGGTMKTAVATGLSPACLVPPDPAAEVGVFVSCVQPVADRYTVVFGYENRGPATVDIPAGSANAVVLSPETTTSAPNRGQITAFLPGRHPSAFQVQGVPRGAVIAWLLAIAPPQPGSATPDATRMAGTAIPAGSPTCATTSPTPTTEPPTTGPQPPALTSLKPLGVQVTCVRINGNGTYDAMFGYTNPNPVTINVPAGSLNTVTPPLGASGDDVGQVTDFQPGATDNAWTAAGVPVATAITWKVSGTTATAGVTSPACPPSAGGGGAEPNPKTPDAGPLVPPRLAPADAQGHIGVFAQCVQVTGKTYTASFGYEMTGVLSLGVPAGEANRTGPEPFRGSVPTSFSPGRHPAVFTVRGIPLKQSVRWTVRGPDGTTAAARSAANGPGCVSQPQVPMPSLEVTVPTPTGPGIPGTPQPQPFIVTNTGSTTAGNVVAIVPPVPGQTIRPAGSGGSGDARCSRATGAGLMRVPTLLPGQSARCVMLVTSATCDEMATTVRASASALGATGAIVTRSGGVGGRRTCHAAGSGVTG